MLEIVNTDKAAMKEKIVECEILKREKKVKNKVLRIDNEKSNSLIKVVEYIISTKDESWK